STAACTQLLDEPAGDRAREGSLAAADPAQELDDPLGRLALQQVSRRTAADRSEQVLLRAVRGQDDDLAAGRRLPQARKRVEPVEPRHREVEQDDVRRQLAGEADRLRAVRG